MFKSEKPFPFMRKGYWRSYRPILLLYLKFTSIWSKYEVFLIIYLKRFDNPNKYAIKGPFSLKSDFLQNLFSVLHIGGRLSFLESGYKVGRNVWH